MARIICQTPAAGTMLAATMGLPDAAASAKETPCEVESMPSKWAPVAVHAHPTVASIATRPCLSSAARIRLRLLSSILSASFSGSQTLLPVSVDTPVDITSICRLLPRVTAAGRSVTGAEKESMAAGAMASIFERAAIATRQAGVSTHDDFRVRKQASAGLQCHPLPPPDLRRGEHASHTEHGHAPQDRRPAATAQDRMARRIQPSGPTRGA